MDRRDFLKFIGIASVFPAVGIAGTASQNQTDTTVFLGDFSVAGFQYHEGMTPGIALNLTIGQHLLIERDRTNPYDPCALKILTPRRNMLGFIPRSQNKTVATLADQGIEMSARIVSVHNDADPWERLTISLWAELTNGSSAEAKVRIASFQVRDTPRPDS